MRPSSQAMDFFAHQDRARRSTLLLLCYFVIAVILIILAVYVAVVLVFFGVEAKLESDLGYNPWNLELLFWISALTLTIVATGAVCKILALSRGGEAVARLLDARPINTNTSDLKERQLLNVVEEMAIASGMPVPTVFLLEKDKSINAFAAGFTPTDAIIGVTRGTVDLLSRDELQGVIAHEFSHIFNGDMRLNIRLMGVLHGILVIALIGYTILRSVRVSGGKKGGGAAVLLFGGALFVIGYVGVFFAKLIKSAVSRQREFLADASAVQFTRNPGGIAGALKKIGGLIHGSKIGSPKAEEASHFFFADGVAAKVKAAGYLSTHPPLAQRIKRIDPFFDGKFPRVEYPRLEAVTEPAPPKARIEADGKLSVIPRQMTDLVGKLTQAHLLYAAALVAALPKRIVDQVHEPSGARAVVFALLLSTDSETRQAQFRMLSESKDPLVPGETLEISTRAERLPPQARLPLIDMALPALRRLSPNQHKEFRALVDRMIMADRKCDLFELTVLHILRRHLDRYFQKTPPPTVQYDSLDPLITECSMLLSGLAHTGHTDERLAKQAFTNGAQELEGTGKKIAFQTLQECNLTAMSKALQKFALVAPKLKRQVLRACASAVSHDQRVTIQEAELLRAIADALDCPLPPFLTAPGFQLDTQGTNGVTP